VSRRLRGVLLPVEAVWAPGAAMDVAGARHPLLAVAGLALIVAALGAAAVPRLLGLLAASLESGGAGALARHALVLHGGLARYLVADRLAPPLPFVVAALLVAAVAVPALGVRGVASRAVVGVLAAGAAPLLVQRLGELAVVWGAPAGLAIGEVVTLPERFNVGVAGILSAAGAQPGGALGVVAEAANGVGLWVVALWGWGLARLSGGAGGGDGRRPRWPFALAAVAYAAGYAISALLFPYYLVVVMGVP
jgi:hypothetical protein